jgi:hypothetical protein
MLASQMSRPSRRVRFRRPEWYFLWIFQALKYVPATDDEGALPVCGRRERGGRELRRSGDAQRRHAAGERRPMLRDGLVAHCVGHGLDRRALAEPRPESGAPHVVLRTTMMSSPLDGHVEGIEGARRRTGDVTSVQRSRRRNPRGDRGLCRRRARLVPARLRRLQREAGGTGVVAPCSRCSKARSRPNGRRWPVSLGAGSRIGNSRRGPVQSGAARARRDRTARLREELTAARRISRGRGWRCPRGHQTIGDPGGSRRIFSHRVIRKPTMMTVATARPRRRVSSSASACSPAS